ncbi:MAG: homoserine kinase [Chloroflexota bacterium]
MAAFTSVEAFAPASMGNVGVGFDILGLAFCEPGDIVRVAHTPGGGVRIAAIEGDGGLLPCEPEKNTASVAVRAFLEMAGIRDGVTLTVRKGLPLGSGLGSSAASAVAAVVAANALFGEPMPREALLPACLEGEAIVSGYHADNVGPSLLGGITLITGATADTILRLPVPDDLHLALVTPRMAVSTAAAREVLPATISLKSMVRQTGAVARLVDALYRGDVPALAAAMEADGVVEPARAHLMPLLDDARSAAKGAGALALVISGAGPTLCAVCDNAATVQQTVDVLQNLYDAAGIGAAGRATRVDTNGARITATTPAQS